MSQIISRLALPAVGRPDKEALHGHCGQVVALTGLSGAGKSTQARLVESLLTKQGLSSAVLDGDVMRAGLCADLGFGPQARSENLRRLGETAAVLLDAGLVVLIAAIMPLAADRARLRARFAPADFLEVFVACDLATCQARDPKGLYAKARQGLIPQFTGVSAPYEAPAAPDIVVHSDREPALTGATKVLEAVVRRVMDQQPQARQAKA